MIIYTNPSGTDFVEVASPTKPLSEQIATFNTASEFQTNLSYLPNQDPVLKAAGLDITCYRDQVLPDAHVSAKVEQLIDGVKEMEWDIDKGKSKSAKAKFYKHFFDDIDIPRFIEDTTNGRLLGYQPIEISWQPGTDLYLPTDLVAKPPEWFRFDRDGNLLFRSKKNTEGEPVSVNNFLIPKFKSTYKNPYGIGILSRCFWPAVIIKGGIKFYLQFIEKWGGAHIIIKVPQSTSFDERNKVLLLGRQLIQNAVSVFNDTDNIDYQEAQGKSASSDLYLGLLEFCEKRISKTVTGETLTTDVGKIGSQALGSVHQNSLKGVVKSSSMLVEKTANDLIRIVDEVNFAERSERPKFIMYEEDDVDLDLATRDKLLSDQGVKLTKKYYMTNYSLEDDDLEDSTAAPVPTQLMPFAGVSPADQAARLKSQGGNGAPPPPSVSGGKQNGGQQQPGQQTQFSEQNLEQLTPDQIAVDKLTHLQTPEQQQAEMEKLLKPVMELINSSTDYSEVIDKLYKQFPLMDQTEIQETLAKMMFLSDAMGRLNA